MEKHGPINYFEVNDATNFSSVCSRRARGWKKGASLSSYKRGASKTKAELKHALEKIQQADCSSM